MENTEGIGAWLCLILKLFPQDVPCLLALKK